MKVLFATSEAAPFAKTGGLGDVAGSLPAALNEKGVETRVVMPLYKSIPQHFKDQMEYIDHIFIDIAWRKQYCGIFKLNYNGTLFYFIDNKFYFDGDKPYDYIHLDCEKFVFFSKAVLSILPTVDFRPDVINCNDWQTGAVPVLLDTFLDNPFYRGIKTVMTIHNLRFQGRWGLQGIKDVMGISDYYFTSDKLEYYKDGNLLKGGMVYANKISTVSQTYAQEITTEEYGEGLSSLLNARRNDLVGIVNGISYTDWNPATDPMIYDHYSVEDFTEKKKWNKTKLQQELNLPVDENRMMIGIVSRLTDQKGFDLIANKMEQLCDGGAQIVVLGTGEEKYEGMFRHFEWKYPDRVRALIYFSNEMSHKIYASADAFLMPSRFEPCGLSQLISLRYGTVPIVRETGGLKDTITPYNRFTGEGNGFSFAHYNADEMLDIIYYAMDTYYNHKDAWNGIIRNGMNADFSWNVSADKYIHMYQEITGIYDLPEKKNESVTEFVKEETPKLAFEEKLKIEAESGVQETLDKIQAEDTSKAPKKKPVSSTKSTAAKKKTPAKKKSTAKKTAAQKEAVTEKENDKSPAASKKGAAPKTASSAVKKTTAKKTEPKKAAVKAEKTPQTVETAAKEPETEKTPAKKTASKKTAAQSVKKETKTAAKEAVETDDAK